MRSSLNLHRDAYQYDGEDRGGIAMPEDMKEPLGRYVLKLGVAALIAAIAKNDNYLLSFSFWVSLYAVFAVVYAVLRREPFSRERVNHWDEAMWLGVTAFFLEVAGRAI